VLEWPANSPDLSAIEPPWRHMKFSARMRCVPKGQKELVKDWTEQWKNFPQDKLRRYVERIQGNLKWVIRLAGRKGYKEGTHPPPLLEGEEEPGKRVWREWIEKSAEEKEAEGGFIEQEDVSFGNTSSSSLSIGEVVYLIRGNRRTRGMGKDEEVRKGAKEADQKNKTQKKRWVKRT
jgi:hypothetical protein